MSNEIADKDSSVSALELTELLVKHYNYHEGTFNLMVEFQIGQGPVGPDKQNLVPGLLIGLSRVGLIPSVAGAPTSVDAAIVNPSSDGPAVAKKAGRTRKPRAD